MKYGTFMVTISSIVHIILGMILIIRSYYSSYITISLFFFFILLPAILTLGTALYKMRILLFVSLFFSIPGAWYLLNAEGPFKISWVTFPILFFGVILALTNSKPRTE
ncbi:hypothetical protein QFZ81_002966 [Paenibacillus sp. V4I9]|uniref:hypothetical protein n=1 Tax=Paenibacillus sp. V4I9 TaxID=3042308 RepID=UPI0027888BA1|nr:hypothetical protein [Paenibacillus sp. V4I9]MDQ0887878.1 hypothetical protein [Paenibacillus sp. V4I9]